MLERQEEEPRQGLTLRRDLCDLLCLLRTHMEQVGVGGSLVGGLQEPNILTCTVT